ncbi:MAG: amidohydrolase family protein [Desulfococcaceae bacterium]
MTDSLKLKNIDCRFRQGAEIHRAGWIAADPQTIIQNGWLCIENGIIREIGQGRISASVPILDHGPGVIIPALINVHTHLELSALKGKISFAHGFRPWVSMLLEKRASTTAEELKKGAQAGIEELRSSGCIAVGEISTLGLTREILRNSGLGGVWFREYLGGMEAVTAQAGSLCHSAAQTESLCCFDSMAGHAPHTTSPELLKTLKENTRKYGLPFSLHLAESEDETEFLRTGKGQWADFLTQRGIDFSGWGLPVENPVAYADQLGLADEKSIFVHLLNAGPEDFSLLKKRGSHVCICPRSNYNLHARLPDLPGMLRAGLHPCMGTDSSASVETLNLFDEMAFTAKCFPEISPEHIFAMSGVNGAAALGLADRFGSLIPGKSGTFIYIPINNCASSNLLERVIHETVF